MNGSRSLKTKNHRQPLDNQYCLFPDVNQVSSEEEPKKPKNSYRRHPAVTMKVVNYHIEKRIHICNCGEPKINCKCSEEEVSD